MIVQGSRRKGTDQDQGARDTVADDGQKHPPKNILGNLIESIKPLTLVLAIAGGTAGICTYSERLAEFGKNKNVEVVTDKHGQPRTFVISKERGGNEPTLQGVVSYIRSQIGSRAHQPDVNTLSFNGLGWSDEDFKAVIDIFSGGIERLEFNRCSALQGECLAALQLPIKTAVIKDNPSFQVQNLDYLRSVSPQTLSVSIPSNAIGGTDGAVWRSFAGLPSLQRLYLTLSGESPSANSPDGVYEHCKRLAADGPEVYFSFGLVNKTFPSGRKKSDPGENSQVAGSEVPLPNIQTLIGSGQ